MKANLTTKVEQDSARLEKPVDSSSRQAGRKRKNIMKTTSARFTPFIALGCSALLYFAAGCSQAPNVPPKEITVQVDDKMRYDFTAFDVSPGQKVLVTFEGNHLGSPGPRSLECASTSFAPG
jgi:hypothetical protein